MAAGEDATGLQQLYAHAVTLHERGDFAAAEAAYSRILDAHPVQPDTLHMLGVLLLQTGRTDAGLQSIGRALAVRPGFVDAHFNRGAALLQAQRFTEALADFDKVIALTPRNSDAQFSRGFTLAALSRPAEALACFDKVLALAPGQPEALLNRGIMLAQLNRPREALTVFERLLAAQPTHVEALINSGQALAALEQFPGALAKFERALALQPLSLGALTGFGVTLTKAGRFGEALDAFDKTLALAPNDASAHFHRGCALRSLVRPEEALASFDAALALRPDYPDTLINRGAVKRTLGRTEEAIVDHDRALALAANSVEALINRGAALGDLLRIEEALASYDRALSIEGASGLARFNKSLLLLLTEQFDDGWREYESRNAAFKGRQRLFTQPPWDGAAPLAGKTLFIHCEQGLGDTIQFCRYATLAADRGANVVLSVQAPLLQLFEGFDTRVRIIGENEAPEAFDLHCGLLSLPGAFGARVGELPPPARLSATPERIADWGAKLGDAAKPRIGLVWSGAAAHENDRNRSIPLATLAPLFATDVEWISLQKEIRDRDRDALNALNLRRFEDALTDFSETAALIANLDLVITVDTSVAHLSTTLGKPTWILLPFAPDWRWLLNRSDSPWYPTARLFRQPAPGAWAPVLEQLAAALRER